MRFRDNILTILGQMSCMTGLMQHMPPLPVTLNQELANSFLPKPGSGMYGPTAQPALTGEPCLLSVRHNDAAGGVGQRHKLSMRGRGLSSGPLWRRFTPLCWVQARVWKEVVALMT